MPSNVWVKICTLPCGLAVSSSQDAVWFARDESSPLQHLDQVRDRTLDQGSSPTSAPNFLILERNEQRAGTAESSSASFFAVVASSNPSDRSMSGNWQLKFLGTVIKSVPPLFPLLVPTP